MTNLWPWLLIAAGVCLIVGALIYRQRMLSRYYDEVEDYDEDAPIGDSRASEPGAEAEAVEVVEEADTQRGEGGDSSTGRDERAGWEIEAERFGTRDPWSTSGSAGDGSAAASAAAASATAAASGTSSTSAEGVSPVAQPVTSGNDPYAGLPDSHVLTEPPTIRWGETSVVLHDWMRYYTDGNVWSDVLSRFTESVDADRELRSYFTASADGSLARHSLSTLMMLTTQGITVGDVRRMKSVHAEVKNEQGEPIDAFVWNQLVDALSNALRENGVRDATLAKLGETLEPLRAAIVPSSS